MSKYIYSFSLFLLIALGLYDIYVLYIYATDVPFWDTWDLMPRGNFKHLFEFYNENMQFFYFLISEIIYKTSNWNLRHFVFVNFVVYLGLIGIYLKILSKAQINNNTMCYPIFLSILLTPMLGFNWLWVFLVQTHTCILFFLLAIYFGFTKDDKKYSALLCGLCLFLSMISHNIPLAIGGTIAYIIKEIVNSKQNSLKISLIKCLQMLGVLAICVLGLSFATDIKRFCPTEFRPNVFTQEYILNFSFYLINSLSAFMTAPFLIGKYAFPLLIIHLIILAIAFFEQYKIKSLQPVWGIIFGIIFFICSVVALRPEEIYHYNYSFIRHNETTFMLLPATLFVLFSSPKKILRGYGVFLLCLMLCGIITDIKSEKFQFFGKLFYQNGCVCLNHYYNLKTISDWKCTMNFPIPHKTGMIIGNEMNLSFIDTIKTCY